MGCDNFPISRTSARELMSEMTGREESVFQLLKYELVIILTFKQNISP